MEAMEIAPEWDDVIASLQAREATYPLLHALIEPILRLIEMLRQDVRLAAARPGLSHLSVTLRVNGVARYVIGEWHDHEPRGYAVSYVDPPLELSEETIVSESQVASTIAEYLA
jgi:hypothetical protein